MESEPVKPIIGLDCVCLQAQDQDQVTVETNPKIDFAKHEAIFLNFGKLEKYALVGISKK